MEVSVSFTDETEEALLSKGYLVQKSCIGNVYYPSQGVVTDDVITISYEKLPWLEAFKVSGLKPVVAKRKGAGSVSRSEFAEMSHEFYDVKIDEGQSYPDYFSQMTAYFCNLIEEFYDSPKGDKDKLKCSMFIGFVENMWREGDSWTEQLVRNTVLPIMYQYEKSRNMINKVASEDFIDYINSLL